MTDAFTSSGTIGYQEPKPISETADYQVHVRYKDLRQQPASEYRATAVSVIGQNYVIFFPDGERLEIHRSNVDSITVLNTVRANGSNLDYKVHLEFKDNEFGDNLDRVESFRRTGNEYCVKFNDGAVRYYPVERVRQYWTDVPFAYETSIETKLA